MRCLDYTQALLVASRSGLATCHLAAETTTSTRPRDQFVHIESGIYVLRRVVFILIGLLDLQMRLMSAYFQCTTFSSTTPMSRDPPILRKRSGSTKVYHIACLIRIATNIATNKGRCCELSRTSTLLPAFLFVTDETQGHARSRLTTSKMNVPC